MSPALQPAHGWRTSGHGFQWDSTVSIRALGYALCSQSDLESRAVTKDHYRLYLPRKPKPGIRKNLPCA